MSEERQTYEKRAEILTKKIMSKIYALEYKALETKLNAEQGITKLDSKLEDMEQQLNQLKEERETLNRKYEEMIKASQEKWQEVSGNFEEYLNQVSLGKQDFAERAQDWINDFNARISDLEEKARNSSGEIRDQVLSQVENLKAQRNRMQERVTELQKTSGERWKNIRDGLDDGLKTMKDSINNLYKNFQSSGEQQTGKETQQ